MTKDEKGDRVLRHILMEFLSLNGVTTAALVGRDGFVIDSVGIPPLDSDALGALSSCTLNFFEKGSAVLEGGGLRQMMLEFGNGAMIFTPVSREEFLVILTDTTKSLGHLTYTIANTSSRIAAAM